MAWSTVFDATTAHELAAAIAQRAHLPCLDVASAPSGVVHALEGLCWHAPAPGGAVPDRFRGALRQWLGAAKRSRELQAARQWWVPLVAREQEDVARDRFAKCAATVTTAAATIAGLGGFQAFLTCIAVELVSYFAWVLRQERSGPIGDRLATGAIAASTA